MFSWFRKDMTCIGSVFFRGPLPPRPEELDGLAAHDVQAKDNGSSPDHHWSLELRHPRWGRAEVLCPREAALPPRELIDWDPRLSKDEKKEVQVYGSAILVRLEPQAHDVLRDRKTLLYFLKALLGSHGLFAMDNEAESCWSRSALEDETSHDAALDIAAMFTMHMVSEKVGEDVQWLHSHGLRDIGSCEFDIIGPDPSCYREGFDSLRALAFAIVEGQIAPDGDSLDLVHPGGSIRLVSARRFQAQAPAAESSYWRENVDEHHLDGHAIVCDPGGRSWFGLGSKAVRPSRFFTQPFPGQGVIHFSTDATALMAERARNTYSAFRALREELAELPLPMLVKLGYVVDGGGENDREHVWFEVHETREREIEGTLVNQPFRIARLKQGDRGAHPVDLISDWQILTPFGPITPAFGTALRELRSHKDELRKYLADAQAQE